MAAGRSALFCLFAVFLAACVSADERIEQMNSQLPLPEETVLLASQTGVGPGGRRMCAVEYLTQLYGSALSAEEIEDVYDNNLSDGGWNRVRPSYLPEDSLIYGLSSRYSLAINIDPSQSIVRDSFFDYNYADDVDPNALESYGTLFITTLVYVAGPGCEFPEE
jgi:hypothetical protein